jgi:hypothetical protein
MKKTFKYFYLPVLTLISVFAIFSHGTPRSAYVTWLYVAIAVAVNVNWLWLVWLLQRQSDLIDRLLGDLSVQLGQRLQEAQRDTPNRRGWRRQPLTPAEEQEAMDYFAGLGDNLPGKGSVN